MPLRLLTRASWSETQRFSEILRKETVGGILLLVAAGAALVWANSPWSAAYRAMSGLAIIAILFGEPACLFKDKLIFKAPGTLGYKLHQDYISWKSFPKSFLTVIMAIDPADALSGATEVFPGYHRRGCMSTEDGNYHQLPDDSVDPSSGVTLDLAPGDIAIFSGYTPHRSAPNRSPHWRRLLYLSYNAYGEGGDQRDQHYTEFRGWLQDRYAEYGRTNTFYR